MNRTLKLAMLVMFSVVTPIFIFFFTPIIDGVAWGPLFSMIASLTIIAGIGGFTIVQSRQAFMKAVSGKNIVLTERRDGFFEWTKADYFTGWLKTKFGFHLMTDKRPEVTTGKNVSIAMDMYGPTITPEDVAAVEVFAKKHNIRSPVELEKLLLGWRKCDKCDWEGIPEPETETKTVTVGGISQEQEVVKTWKCGGKGCKGKGDDLIEITPSVLVPFYKTVSLEHVKLLFKYAMNPSKAMVLVDRLLRVKSAGDESLLHFLGRMIGLGLFALLAFAGVGLMFKIMGVI